MDDLAPAVKRRRQAWIATLFVAVFLVLAGGAVVGYNLLNARPAVVQQVPIPSLSGVSLDEAMSQLRNLEMEPYGTEEYSSLVDAGGVIRTNPAAGMEVNPHSAVEVFVSKGPSEVTIPDNLAGKTESEVRADLAVLNLIINPNELVNDGTVPATFVVTTDPAPGETVPVNSSITLNISTGQVMMPSLFDLTKDPKKVKGAVTAELESASPYLEVTFEEAENTVVTPGMVTNQSVPAGTPVAQHTSIVVILAKAPEPAEPSPSKTPASTPKPTPTPTKAQ